MASSDNKIKETLDFLLHSYRAKLAVDNPSENCPFDFTEFLQNWEGKYENWEELKNAILQDLQPLANEGLFDSILPYLTASLNQARSCKDYGKKSGGGSYLSRDFVPSAPLISAELTPLSLPSDSGTTPSSTPTLLSSGKRGSKDKSRKHDEESDVAEFDPEIIIHVCDEAKGLKRDFYCSQSILVKEMGYFTKVTVKGQRLRDMDISVHCDISVFEWLMRWVKSRNGGYEQSHGLDPTTVVGLMVSADFLQMGNLVTECLQYVADNISQVINLSPNLGCLNEPLTNKILHFFNNFEVETRINHIDRGDRITSRFYTQLIMALNEPEPDEALGHFASTSTLFQCTNCGQLLINTVASKVPCCSVKCDSRGRIFASHVRDPNWTLCQFVRDLKRELKVWKRVYWRLWSLVHFFCCSHCHQYFAAADFSSCRYHPQPPAASVVVVNMAKAATDESEDGITPRGMVQGLHGQNASARRTVQLKKDVDAMDQDGVTDTIICPYGTYPCCKQPSYLFYPFPSSAGCDFREHSMSQYAEDDPALKLITAFNELIVVQPSRADKKGVDWSTLIDLTPQKSPSTSSTATILSQRATASSVYGFRDAATRRRMMFTESSSTESNSFSDNEEVLPKTDETFLFNQRCSNLNEYWSWNPEYTTRYNQDMQREREEKLMADLEMLLAQRVAIDSGGSSGFPSSIRLGYLSRRTQKNSAGSFVKLEEKWKEEVQQSGSKSGKHTSRLSKI